MYTLTKSKIITGLQCHKKLWFDVNEPIKGDSHLFHLGNRLGDFARTYYAIAGQTISLDGQYAPELILQKTQEAMSGPSVQVIYEAAFLQMQTLVRVDVLKRLGNAWEVIEIKASTELKALHIDDVSIQVAVMRANGIQVRRVKIGHINKEFIYEGNEQYAELITEVDVTEAVNSKVNEVGQWIAELLPVATKGAAIPKIEMGAWCNAPYVCLYQARCLTAYPPKSEHPIEILPKVGKKMAQEWNAKGVFDIRELPVEALTNPIHQAIQKAHQTLQPWFDPEIIAQIKLMPWPRYFMDFETVQQGVPLIVGTKPYQAIPFQWSVHRWDNVSQVLSIADGKSFLEFISPTMFKDFSQKLIDELGSLGPIFVHHKPTERGVLKYLMEREDCADLAPQIGAIIDRLVDSLELVRKGFYTHQMGQSTGNSYSIKTLVEVIPTTVNYQEGNVGSGMDAQIAWFVCTDPKSTQSEKDKWTKSVLNYCAKDTLAVADLIKHFETQ